MRWTVGDDSEKENLDKNLHLRDYPIQSRFEPREVCSLIMRAADKIRGVIDDRSSILAKLARCSAVARHRDIEWHERGE